jgi:hypothetical protein
LLLLDLSEQRRFLNTDPDPQTKADQHDAGEEWQAPAPFDELIGRQQQRDQANRASCQQRAERRSHLRPRGVAPATLRIAMLNTQQHSAGPLTAQCCALDESQ